MSGSMGITKKRIDTRVRNYYSDSNDMHRYLVDTIIFWKNEPYWFKYDGSYFFLMDLNGAVKKLSPEDLKSADLNVAAPELGYANVNKFPSGKQVVYAERTVWKRWKQGVSTQNTVFLNIQGDQIGGGFHQDPGFWESLRDSYPTLDETMELLKTDSEVAISKEVALSKRPSGITLVFYKTKEVGYMTPENDSFNLKRDSYSWIIERYLSDLNLKIVSA